MTAQQLDEHCHHYLATFKVPKVYEFPDHLPKTSVGKMLRKQLIIEEKEKYCSKKGK